MMSGLTGFNGFRYSSEVSVSCLTYLFADQFVGGVGWFGRAMSQAALVTPTTGKWVNFANAERQCFAAAIWSLKHQELITISDGARHASNRLSRIGERPTLLFEAIGDGEDVIGVEGLLLAALRRPIDASQLYRDAIALEPLDTVLARLRDEAVGANVASVPEKYGRRVPKSLHWSNSSECKVRPEAQRSLERQFRVADDLGLFGRDQPDFKELRRQCSLAVYRGPRRELVNYVGDG
jgi:hypothetical protein